MGDLRLLDNYARFFFFLNGSNLGREGRRGKGMVTGKYESKCIIHL